MSGLIFGRAGWQHFDAALSRSDIEGLHAFQNSCFDSIRPIVQRHSGVDLDRFKEENIFELEIAKSSIRALLRYHPLSLNIIRTISDLILKDPVNKYFGDMAFLTLPYILIHLQNDTSERGGYHGDAYPYTERFITTWTPIHEYAPNQLIMIPGSHRWPSKVRALFSRVYNSANPFSKSLARMSRPIFERYPYARLSDFLAWDGNTIHKGNINRTRSVSSALVFRLTNRPIMSEPALSYTRFCTFRSRLQPGNVESIYSFLRKVIFELKDAANNKNFDLMSPLERWDLFSNRLESTQISEPFTRKLLSFALSIFGQRMEKFGLALPYYYGSLYFGNENLISFSKILEMQNAPENFQNLVNFGEHIKAQNRFQQHYFQFDQWYYKASGAAAPLDNGGQSLPLLEWGFEPPQPLLRSVSAAG